MRNIFVITDELLITDRDSWETNTASLLCGYVEACNLDYKIHTISNLNEIYKEFTNNVKKNDIFLFTNAWSPIITYVKHWSELRSIKVKMLGMFHVGSYTDFDQNYTPLKDKKWRISHEHEVAKCLDKLYFISDVELGKFCTEIKGIGTTHCKVIAFPLDYLDLELSSPKENFYKQDIVIFPWENYTLFHEQILYDFIRVFKNIKVYFAQEHQPIDRRPLLNQMAKSKLAFLPYTSSNIGKEVYECLLLETIPLVPDTGVFKTLVPDEFRYPLEWTTNIFNYSKYAENLTNKIKELIYNYDNYIKLIQQTQEYLNKKYFNSEQLMQEIFVNLDII
jgi:hypothetical protein